MLEPLYDWVVLEPQYEKETFEQTITECEFEPRSIWGALKGEPLVQKTKIIEASRKNLLYYVVIAVGPGIRFEGQFVKPHISVGQKVTVRAKISTYSNYNDFQLCRESDIAAIIKEEE